MEKDKFFRFYYYNNWHCWYLWIGRTISVEFAVKNWRDWRIEAGGYYTRLSIHHYIWRSNAK